MMLDERISPQNFSLASASTKQVEVRASERVAQDASVCSADIRSISNGAAGDSSLPSTVTNSRAQIGLRTVGCVFALLLLLLAQPASAAGAVNLDVPALVVAEQVDSKVVQQPAVSGKFIRLRFPVSTYVSSQFHGEVAEYVVELSSPNESMRIVDFWPRDQVYSQIAGSIAIESTQQSEASLKLNVAGGYQPLASGSFVGDYQRKESMQERYERLPPMHALTSSGTIHRGYGVYFKFRPGPAPDLEGSRELAILAEVSADWRADLLHVRLSASGSASGAGSRRSVLGDAQLWMTVHQEGDLAAAAQARRFLTQERSLRALAASRAMEIKSTAMPTIFHRFGAALDVVEPYLPADYLSHVIFGPRNQYFEGAAHRLPIDLKIAILDYWDERETLARLAFGYREATEQPAIQLTSGGHLQQADAVAALRRDEAG